MARHALRTAEPAPAKQPPLAILLVEDEASDRVLAKAAFDTAGLACEIQTLQDGREVLPYLQRQGKYSDTCMPDVMFLDLSLPAKDGFEVLADLAEQPTRFGHLPIVILTGDTHCAFLKHSCDLTIAAYVTKPCTAEKISAALADIQRQ